MIIYDISLPISANMVVWLGNPAVEIGRISSMDAGAPDNISRLACDDLAAFGSCFGRNKGKSSMFNAL